MKIQISALDSETLEISERSTKANTWPRRGRPRKSPSEARSVAIHLVKQLSATHKPGEIRSAITRKVARINADRSPDYWLRNPSGRQVKYLLLEQRRRHAPIPAASIPSILGVPERLDEASRPRPRQAAAHRFSSTGESND